MSGSDESRPGVWAAAGQAVMLVANLGRSAAVARLLEPDGFGRFLVLASVATVAGTGLAGLSTAAVRRVAASEDAGAASFNVRAVCHIALAGNAVLLAAIAALHRWWGTSPAEAAAFGAFLTVTLWLGLGAALARGLGRIVYAIQVEQIAVPAVQAAAVAACLFRTRPSSLAMLMALQAAAALPFAVVLARRIAAVVDRRSRALPVRLRRDVALEAAPAVLTMVVWRGLVDAPLWVADAAIGGSAAAVFGVAQRIASLLQVPGAALSSMLAPTAAALAARGQYDELEHRLRRGARDASMAAAAGLVAIVAAGPRVLRIVYGPYFAQAAPLVVVLASAHLINSAAGLGGMTLQMMNQSRRLLALSAVSLALLLAALWPAAAALGAIGLAWAWLAMVIVQNALLVAAVRRVTGMRVYLTLR